MDQLWSPRADQIKMCSPSDADDILLEIERCHMLEKPHEELPETFHVPRFVLDRRWEDPSI